MYVLCVHHARFLCFVKGPKKWLGVSRISMSYHTSMQTCACGEVRGGGGGGAGCGCLYRQRLKKKLY